MRDEHERHAVVLDERKEQLEDLGLDRDIERGRRLVRDQQARPARERHRDRRALPLAPGELMGVARHDALGVGQGDAGCLGHCTCAGLGAREPLVDAHRLADLPPDRADRVERGARLLEHDADLGAANRRQLAVGHADQLTSVPAHAAPGDGVVGEQPEDSEGRQGFSRARLADQPDAGAVGHVERDAVHHAALADVDGQAGDLERHATTSGTCRIAPRGGCKGSRPCESVGSVASRRASPSRFSPSTVKVIARPGQSTDSG